MNARVVVPILCALSCGCSRAPPVWTSGPLSLPPGEHAYALPVSYVSMVRGDLDPDAWEELMEHCAKARSAEVEEPEEEEEAQAREITRKEGETKETGTNPGLLAGAPRSNLVASDLEITALDTVLPERPLPSLRKPTDLPELFLAPAVLTATLDEVT